MGREERWADRNRWSQNVTCKRQKKSLILDGGLMSQMPLIKLFEHVCQIMRENRGAMSMKSIGPNLAVPPDGDLPQVQIFDSVCSE